MLERETVALAKRKRAAAVAEEVVERCRSCKGMRMSSMYEVGVKTKGMSVGILEQLGLR